MKIKSERINLKDEGFNITDSDEARYKRLLDETLIEEEVVGNLDEITIDYVMDFIKQIKPRQFGKPTKVLALSKSYLDSILLEYGVTKETLEIALNCTIVINEYMGKNIISFDKKDVKFNRSHYFANKLNHKEVD